MLLINGLDALQALDLDELYGDSPQSRSVVAVGVFDGVHLGHLRLLHNLLEMASALQATPTVVTFRNHPDQLIHGKTPALLVSVEHRLRLLRRAGVHRLVTLDFEPRLMNMPPRQFAVDLLLDKLHMRGLLLGYDSALGKDRAGTPAFFEQLGAELGFETQVGEPVQIDEQTVSSTLIREAIAQGDLAAAQRYLGRFPSTIGEVVHGDGRGKTLGFPTANLVTECPVLPPNGVYAVEIIMDGRALPAIANLGVRPTFARDDKPVLEVHLLDFEGDLYGRELELCFLEFLRPERKFANVEELKEQISADIAAARRRLLA